MHLLYLSIFSAWHRGCTKQHQRTPTKAPHHRGFTAPELKHHSLFMIMPILSAHPNNQQSPLHNNAYLRIFNIRELQLFYHKVSAELTYRSSHLSSCDNIDLCDATNEELLQVLDNIFDEMVHELSAARFVNRCLDIEPINSPTSPGTITAHWFCMWK